MVVSDTSIDVFHLFIRSISNVHSIHDIERLAEIDIELMIGELKDVYVTLHIVQVVEFQ